MIGLIRLPAAVSSSLPHYVVENGSQTSSLLLMNALDEADPSFQMLPEMRMRFAILALSTVADTVGKDRLQEIEIGSSYIQALVGYQPRKMLAHRLAHDARLAVLNGKTFRHENHCDIRGESLDTTIEAFVSGEGQVVGIACVGASGRLSQPGKAAVEAIAA